MIHAINPVGSTPQLVRSAPAASTAVSTASFKRVLLESIEQTKLLQGASGANGAAAGQTAAAVQKADLTLSAATQIYHALTRAYHDINDIHG